MVNALPKRRSYAGLPNGEVIQQFYCDRADCFIVQMIADRAFNRHRSVFARRHNEKSYRKLGPKSPSNSWEELVIRNGKLFILSNALRKTGEVLTQLLSLDLRVDFHAREVCPLEVCEPVALLGASADGKWVYFRSGPWRRVTPDGETVGDYFLAKVASDGSKFTKIRAMNDRY